MAEKASDELEKEIQNEEEPEEDNNDELCVETSSQSTGGAKKKRKKKKKKVETGIILNGDDSKVVASSASNARGVDELQKVFRKIMIEGNQQDQNEKDKKFEFWDTQPVPKLGNSWNLLYYSNNNNKPCLLLLLALIQCGKNAFSTPDIFYHLFLPTPIAIIGISNIRSPRQRELAPALHQLFMKCVYPYTVANIYLWLNQKLVTISEVRDIFRSA